MELISIIIPVYKVEKYLESCLNSIVNQTYQNLEIIVIDDGGKDNCPAICDKYAKIDSRIKVVHQENRGLSGARNAGIDIANGKYIIFVDSDDTVEKDLVKELYNCMNKYNTDIAICGRNYVFEDGNVICKQQNDIEKIFEFEEAIIEMNKFELFDMSAWAKIYKTDLFEQIRFPEGKLSEDYFIMYKLIELAGKVSYISKPLYNYLQRQSSISRNKNINHDFIEAAKKQLEDLEPKYPRIKNTLHVAYASSNLTVLDFYIKNKVKCPKEKIKEFRKVVKENLIYINKDKNIRRSKKYQFYIFLINYNLYKIVFKIFRKIRRV